jgi:hypothetical protein
VASLTALANKRFKQVIPTLSKLEELHIIELMFPNKEELSSDRDSVEAARKVLEHSKAKGEKILWIRMVEFWHKLEEDNEHSCQVEVVCMWFQVHFKVCSLIVCRMYLLS